MTKAHLNSSIFKSLQKQDKCKGKQVSLGREFQSYGAATKKAILLDSHMPKCTVRSFPSACVIFQSVKVDHAQVSCLCMQRGGGGLLEQHPFRLSLDSAIFFRDWCRYGSTFSFSRSLSEFSGFSYHHSGYILWR